MSEGTISGAEPSPCQELAPASLDKEGQWKYQSVCSPWFGSLV